MPDHAYFQARLERSSAVVNREEARQRYYEAVEEVHNELADIDDQMHEISVNIELLKEHSYKSARSQRTSKVYKYGRRIRALIEDFDELQRRRKEVAGRLHDFKEDLRYHAGLARDAGINLAWETRIHRGPVTDLRKCDLMETQKMTTHDMIAPYINDSSDVHALLRTDGKYHLFWGGQGAPLGDGHGHAVFSSNFQYVWHRLPERLIA